MTAIDNFHRGLELGYFESTLEMIHQLELPLAEITVRPFGPKSADHPSVGTPCPACHQEFAEGDFTCLIPIGPGDHEDSRRAAMAGKAYNAVALEIHWACVTGFELRVLGSDVDLDERAERLARENSEAIHERTKDRIVADRERFDVLDANHPDAEV